MFIACAVIVLLGYERVWMRTHLVPQTAYQMGKSTADVDLMQAWLNTP